MLRFLTAGESHGKALVTIIEGIPAGLTIDLDAITSNLRGVKPATGAAAGCDRIGSRRAAQRHPAWAVDRRADRLLIPNKDWENWQRTMYVEAAMRRGLRADRLRDAPRPGTPISRLREVRHDDMRNVLERASARETRRAWRLARSPASCCWPSDGDRQPCRVDGSAALADRLTVTFDRVRALSPDARCLRRPGVEQQMIAEIDRAREAGDTMAQLRGDCPRVPPGLGSYVQWTASSMAGSRRR